jgi:hypothetical protein
MGRLGQSASARRRPAAQRPANGFAGPPDTHLIVDLAHDSWNLWNLRNLRLVICAIVVSPRAARSA